jgi:integrase
MPKQGSTNEKPKVTGKLRERRHLRPEEARKLIDAAGKRGRYRFHDRVFLRMIYRHGLRASEAVGLRWSAIDLEHGILHVERSKAVVFQRTAWIGMS